MTETESNVVSIKQDQYSRLDLFKPDWYIQQFKGWTSLSYKLLIVGYVIIAVTTLLKFSSTGISLAPLTGQSVLTWIAAMLGFTCTLAITNAKPMNGVLGLVSAVIYIFMALEAKNPADAMLQGFYIIVLDIPVLVMPSWAKNVEKKIRFIHETGKRGENHSPIFWYSTIGAVAVVAFITAFWFETQMLHSPRPYADSFVLGTGMAGAILTTLRFSESGIAWIVQGVAQVILWGYTAMHGDANWVLFATYMMYVANDLVIIFQSKWFHHKEITKSLSQQVEFKKAV